MLSEPSVFRTVTYPRDVPRRNVAPACRELARLARAHEGLLHAMAAAVLLGGAAPLEVCVGVVLTSPGPDGEEPLVRVVPREAALEIAHGWTDVRRALAGPSAPGRLDLLLEAGCVLGVASLDLDLTLPVRRGQAEGMHLPARLLFAKGAAFASVRDEPASVDTLRAAWAEHGRVLDRREDELVEELGAAAREPGECAGVVLSFGGENEAVAAVSRSEARALVSALVSAHPALARRVDQCGDGATGAAEHVVPVVVWAGGHLSVRKRRVAVGRGRGRHHAPVPPGALSPRRNARARA